MNTEAMESNDVSMMSPATKEMDIIEPEQGIDWINAMYILSTQCAAVGIPLSFDSKGKPSATLLVRESSVGFFPLTLTNR